MFHRLFEKLTLDLPKAHHLGPIGDFAIPENAEILRQLHRFAPTFPYADPVEEVRGQKTNLRQVNGHPDLHDYLWLQAGSDLPPDARWIVRGNAAFAHPKTKIIFAIASGTHSIQIRIPAPGSAACDETKAQDHDSNLASFVWASSNLNEAEDRKLLQIALDAASRSSASRDP